MQICPNQRKYASPQQLLTATVNSPQSPLHFASEAQGKGEIRRCWGSSVGSHPVRQNVAVLGSVCLCLKQPLLTPTVFQQKQVLLCQLIFFFHALNLPFPSCPGGNAPVSQNMESLTVRGTGTWMVFSLRRMPLPQLSFLKLLSRSHYCRQTNHQILSWNGCKITLHDNNL